jgi:hypothetical protein
VEGVAGWGEMRVLPHYYSDEVLELDRSLLNLVAQRQRLTGRKRFYPSSREQLEQLSEETGLDLDAVSLVLHSLNAHVNVRPPITDESVIGVLPLMKRADGMQCEFLITHAIQYETHSMLTIEAKFTGEEDDRVSLRPMLDLVVLGGETEYVTNSQGTSGGGMKAELRFRVMPRLPDDISSFALSLAPGGYSIIPEMKEIRLDRQVDFD